MPVTSLHNFVTAMSINCIQESVRVGFVTEWQGPDRATINQLTTSYTRIGTALATFLDEEGFLVALSKISTEHFQENYVNSR